MGVRGKCLKCKVTIGLVLFGPGSIGQETFVLFALTFWKELLSFSHQTEFVVVAVLCFVVAVVFLHQLVYFYTCRSCIVYTKPYKNRSISVPFACY